MKSKHTFAEEFETLRETPGVFWDEPAQYEARTGRRPFRSLTVPGRLSRQMLVSDELLDARTFRTLEGTRLIALHDASLLDKLGAAAKSSDADFVEAFWHELGLDLEELLPEFAGKVNGAELAALTAEFGTEAFGCYLPWHAYVRSAGTPWGVYMFLEKLFVWAGMLHASGSYLPNPTPPVMSVFRLLWWLTYRHELFHFHVELFATRLEICSQRPVYRPYVENVGAKVVNSPEWLEEALAQAVVLKSTLVRKALGVDARYMKKHVMPYFRDCFPAGYKDFECKSFKGAANGHRLFSAQISRGQLHPHPLNTDVALAKSEYRVSNMAVPGYVLFTPDFCSRFQLATPRLGEVERYARSKGYLIDENAPGDHKRIVANGVKIQLNRAKGKEIDLASIKALAKHEGLTVHDLIHEIRKG